MVERSKENATDLLSFGRELRYFITVNTDKDSGFWTGKNNRFLPGIQILSVVLSPVCSPLCGCLLGFLAVWQFRHNGIASCLLQ